MLQLIAIALGGALGAVMRYSVSLGVHGLFGRSFPIGTLSVNVLGCFGMGILYVLLLERFTLGGEWRAALQIGLLGAFTTFSTFSIESIILFENGEMVKAWMNIVFSVVFCLAATWVGIKLGRNL